MKLGEARKIIKQEYTEGMLETQRSKIHFQESIVFEDIFDEAVGGNSVDIIEAFTKFIGDKQSIKLTEEVGYCGSSHLLLDYETEDFIWNL